MTTGQPLPGWNVNASYSQFKAEDADDVPANTDQPRKLLKIFTTYDLGGALTGLTIGGGVNYRSKAYSDGNNPVTGDAFRFQQDGYTLVALMARYAVTPQLQLQANVDNLFDKDPVASPQTNTGLDINPALYDTLGRIYRAGSNDDALGIAALFEIARAFKAAPAPDRSILFAAWTAEERGLLGSEHYALNPVYPLDKTVANLTIDILQTAGKAKDVIMVGKGQGTLEDDLARFAARQGRVVTQESLPERGLFYRADHFSLAKRGVPVMLMMGIAGASDLVEGGRAAGQAWVDAYTGTCYHQACDAVDDSWNLEGAAQDVMRKPPQDKRRGVFTNQIIVDMIVYGIIMGVCTMCTFCIIIYGAYDGDLGEDCNTKFSKGCEPVFNR